jgi:hypothetical protein
MIKRITLLLATLLAVGHFSTTVFAQDGDSSGDKSTSTSADTPPADDKDKKKAKGGGDEPECD